MNFGKWIVVAFVLFALFIAALVTVCVRQDISLVSKEYYKEELDYQNQIVRLNNTSQLIDKPVIKVTDHKLVVEFNQLEKIEKGELKLFCPSNVNMDRNFKIAPDKSLQSFGLESLQKGMYRAKLLWEVNGRKFYQEEIIFI